MDEHFLKSVGVVVLGVLVAGYVMATFAQSISLIGTAEAGFTGAGG